MTRPFPSESQNPSACPRVVRLRDAAGGHADWHLRRLRRRHERLRDAVNLFNAAGARVTGVSFGGAATGTPVATFDNSAGLGAATLPLPVVTAISADKVNGAFVSFNGAEVGSPGARIVASPLTTIDLSTYVRVGRFDLPEPTRTPPPPGNLLILAGW